MMNGGEGRGRINYVRQWPYFPQPGVTVEKDKRYSKARHTEERQGDRDKTHQQYSKLYFIDYETLYFSGAVLLLKGLFTKKNVLSLKSHVLDRNGSYWWEGSINIPN